MDQDSANNISQSSGILGLLKKLLPIVLVIGFAGFLYWDYFIDVHDGAYDDYESAGAHVRKQIDKGESPVYVQLNTGKHNPRIGYDRQLEGVLKAAMPHTGNPEEGDHLVLSVWPVASEAHIVEMNDDTYNLNMNITMQYRMTKEQKDKLKAKCNVILSELHLNGKSDYEKVRAIYGYICSHVTYDYYHYKNDPEYPMQYCAYAAAIDGTAVCSGVADLFYYLANSAGLDARIKTNSDHAWNFVKVDGKYYYLDATWDLGKREADWEYFLKGRMDYNAHPGLISLTYIGSGSLLNDTDAGYTISTFGYGA